MKKFEFFPKIMFFFSKNHLLFWGHFFIFEDIMLKLAHNVLYMVVNQENRSFPTSITKKIDFFPKLTFFSKNHLLFQGHFFIFEDIMLKLSHNVLYMMMNQEKRLFPTSITKKIEIFQKLMFFS